MVAVPSQATPSSCALVPSFENFSPPFARGVATARGFSYANKLKGAKAYIYLVCVFPYR